MTGDIKLKPRDFEVHPIGTFKKIKAYEAVLVDIRDNGIFPADQAGRVLAKYKKQRSH